jgi:hypothetical protein
MERFPCACCGYKTFKHPAEGSYDICEVCFWEDDPVQFKDPNFEGGANLTSLSQAQENFISFGASDRRFLGYVRKPEKSEDRDQNWRRL